MSDSVLLEVRISNAGRRPIKVEQVGFGVMKDRTLEFHGWMKWDRSRDPELPVSQWESDSVRIWTWLLSIARWLVRYQPPKWLYLTNHTGRAHWHRLPDRIASAIQAEWPKAQAEHEKTEAEKKAKEAQGEPLLDDYGQPLGNEVGP